MRFYFLCFFVCFSLTQSFAQLDGVNNPINIPPAELPKIPSISPEKKPSIFDIKPKEETTPNPWDKPKEREFNQQNDFMNPADRYTDKMNNSLKGEGNGDYKIFRRNQYFGDFKTDSEFILVLVRDPAAIDGDYVKITRDGILVYDRIFLEANFKTYRLNLNKGFNRIEMVGLNEGELFPNTGAFKIIDKGETIYQEEWAIATGFKASFIIIRE